MFLPAGILRFALCAAMERTRYAMNGIAIERDDKGKTTIAATDGKRLVMAELDAPLSVPSELATKYGIADDGKRIGLTVLSTVDETDREGKVIAKGLTSLARDERKATIKARASELPAKPARPNIPAKVKRPKMDPLPKMPKLPKRSAFVALAGETTAETMERFKAERERVKAERDTVASQRRTVKGLNGAKREEHKRRIAERKATIAADREKYARELIAWRKARKEARRAQDIIALDPSREGFTCGVSFAPGRVRELKTLEGHFPPYRDVLPKPSRANSHELIVDARALALIVDSWNATIAANVRCSSGPDTDIPRIEAVRMELEGRNVRISGSAFHASTGAMTFRLTEFQAGDVVMERWMRVVSGEGKVTIGFNPYFLSEMADALHSGIGSTVAGDAFVRIGIKDACDAMLVAPCNRDDSRGPYADAGETFAPSLRGVRVTGLLMPINLA